MRKRCYTKLNTFFHSILVISLMLLSNCNSEPEIIRSTEMFTSDWKFNLGDVPDGYNPGLDDSAWRVLELPHDWSIEGEFSEDHPAGPGGGALPGGIGWYRKSFTLDEIIKDKQVFIEFDGIYRNSEVWINGYYLGKRPNGYISFRYDLTSHLHFGDTANVLAVKVDNSKQPNSRWYSGSGIYRNVRLVKVNKIFVDHWGTHITTPWVSNASAKVNVKTIIKNRSGSENKITLITQIRNHESKIAGEAVIDTVIKNNKTLEIEQVIDVDNLDLWSVEHPNLYEANSTIKIDNKTIDDYKTTFGIRSFEFDSEDGFILNGEQVKIKGVCNHHDLGCLGTAVNKRAIERRLEILKEMGCNGIRTAHNPPAPELLDLCDRMGFIVMDEIYDMWAKAKTEFDYSLDWTEWHKKDLEDFILRDRNHPSVFIWSIGNEVIEQYNKSDSSGSVIARELKSIVTSLDETRPVTANCNDTDPRNPVLRSGALDIIGYSYHEEEYENVPEIYPGLPFIASETESSLHTRGSYDMPSDSIRRWPYRWDEPFNDGNSDYTCSSYDNCSAPWGSTHEETWSLVKKNDFISGMYTWTGFDYLGEPTPYSWPARSSFFGLIDLAGFPKDPYYLYKSEWTDEPVLHLFPHWNNPAGKKEGECIDVWAYTNCDEVELFLNGEAVGVRTKDDNNLHLEWRLTYRPGTLKAVGRLDGNEILTKEINTAGKPSQIRLEADRETIYADGKDLSFITVKVLDENGNLVPYADNLIKFDIKGEGKIAGVDNGLQTSHEPFKADYRKAFNGLCLAVVQSSDNKGEINFHASSEGLMSARVIIKTR